MVGRTVQWFKSCQDFVVSGGTFTSESQNVEYASNHTSAIFAYQRTEISLPTPTSTQPGIAPNVDAKLYAPPYKNRRLDVCGVWTALVGVMMLSLAIKFKSAITPPITTSSVPYGFLPPPLALYGQERLMKEILDAILLKGGGIKAHICLRGAPGIGKTAIATTIIHNSRIIRHFGNERHWVRCQETSNTTATLKAEMLLEHVADSFGIELKPSSDRRKDIQIFLITRNAPRIIVLDNFETVWEPLEARETVEGILQFLAHFPQLTIVVTTRNSINPAMDKGVTWYATAPIDPLSLDASRKLFTSLCPPQFIDNHLDVLLHEIGYIPFIITLMASYAQENYMTAQILEIWRRRFSQPDGEQEYTRNSDLIRLDNSIATSLEGPLINSTMHAPALLRIIAELPGGMKKKNLQRIASGIPYAHEIVGVLVRASLVVNTSDTYQMHEYIRSFMLRNYPLDPIHRESVQNFYFHLIHDLGGEPGDPDFLERNRRLQYEEINAEAILADGLRTDFTRWASIALDYSNYQIWNSTTTGFLTLTRDHLQPVVEHGMIVLTEENLSWSWRTYHSIHPKILGADISSGLTLLLLPFGFRRVGQLSVRNVVHSDPTDTSVAIKKSGIFDKWPDPSMVFEVIPKLKERKGESYSQACDQGLFYLQNNVFAAAKIVNESRTPCSLVDCACIADNDSGHYFWTLPDSACLQITTIAGVMACLDWHNHD